MQRRLIAAVGGILGVYLMTRWWNAHGQLFSELTTLTPWALLVGLLGLPASLALQLERTRRILGLAQRKTLVRPVFTAHGVNVLLPSLLGDLYEIGALSTITNTPIHTVLTRLIHRFVTTLSALGVLAALALGTISLPYGVGLFLLAIIAPHAVDRLTRRWSTLLRLPTTPTPQPLEGLGTRETFVHTLLAIVQHGLSAAGLFFLGIGLGDHIQPAVAAAMLSIADLITYLPVPMAGIGVHHWSTTAAATLLGEVPAILIAAHHGWIVLVGCGCIGLAYWVRDRAE